MGDIESRPRHALGGDVEDIEGFDVVQTAHDRGGVGSSADALAQSQRFHADTLDDDKDLLYEQAYKLLHSCRLELNTRYERYRKAYTNLSTIRETVKREPFHSEAVHISKTNSAPSPDLRRLFASYREYDEELRRNDREIHNLEGTLKLYKDLVQKVKDHLNDSSNRELLKDYAATVQRVCEQMGSQGENPIDRLLAVTDQIHQGTTDVGMTTETLRDEMMRLKDVQNEESAEIVDGQRRMFSRFVSDIAGSSASESGVRVSANGYHESRVVRDERGQGETGVGVGVELNDDDRFDSDCDYELSDDEGTEPYASERPGQMPRALLDTLPSVPHTATSDTVQAVDAVALKQDA